MKEWMHTNSNSHHKRKFFIKKQCSNIFNMKISLYFTSFNSPKNIKNCYEQFFLLKNTVFTPKKVFWYHSFSNLNFLNLSQYVYVQVFTTYTEKKICFFILEKRRLTYSRSSICLPRTVSNTPTLFLTLVSKHSTCP